jgi:dihydroorotase
MIITLPDDFHLHLRDGDVLADLLPDTVRCFGRALVMPNLRPPVTTVAQAGDYRRRIRTALPQGSDFEPLMSLYLTETTPAEEIHRARDSGFVKAVKYYPAGATTNADAGVRDWRRCDDVFSALSDTGLPLLVHGEVADPEVDIFHRESVFLDTILAPILAQHPRLKVVLEHVSTSHGVRFVQQAGANVAATLTAHHLLLTRNDLFRGGIRPHHYCLPVVKTEMDRQALRAAATSGNPKFFLGTDSAPHARSAKESCCGPAGIGTAHAAVELYAEVFAAAGCLDRLENFASRFGARFYGLPENQGRLSLVEEAWQVPEHLTFGNDERIPFRAGETLGWRARRVA